LELISTGQEIPYCILKPCSRLSCVPTAVHDIDITDSKIACDDEQVEELQALLSPTIIGGTL